MNPQEHFDDLQQLVAKLNRKLVTVAWVTGCNPIVTVSQVDGLLTAPVSQIEVRPIWYPPLKDKDDR